MAIAHDPGGANMLLPVLSRLKNEGLNIVPVARGPAANIWREMDMSVESRIESVDMLRDLIERVHPDLIITGTSMSESSGYGTDIDRDAWTIARSLAIQSIAGIDASMNLRQRFLHSKSGALVLPDFLCLADQQTHAALKTEPDVEVGSCIVGQPHLEKTTLLIMKGRSTMPAAVRTTVIFFSEPVKLALPEHLQPGFDEFEVATILLRALKSFDADLVIKPHPHETVEKWQTYLADHAPSGKLSVTVSAETSLALHMRADAVFGIGSMVLNEASLAQIPTAAIQPDRQVVMNPSIDDNPAIEKFYTLQGIEQKLLSFAKNRPVLTLGDEQRETILGSCERFAHQVKVMLKSDFNA